MELHIRVFGEKEVHPCVPVLVGTIPPLLVKSASWQGFLRLMDLELFATRCKRERDWSHEQALSQWHALRSDSSVARDQNGPKHFPLRLEVPGWIFGEEGTEHRAGDFEEKRINIMSRTSSANAESISVMRDELYTGFQQKATLPSMDDVQAAMSSGQSSNSVTREDFDKSARRGEQIAELLTTHRPREAMQADVAAGVSQVVRPGAVPALASASGPPPPKAEAVSSLPGRASQVPLSDQAFGLTGAEWRSTS